jgi:hemerythrin superfamily protein
VTAPARDGYTALAEDHRSIERLVDRFFVTGDEALAREVGDVVATHAAAEEQALYPELAGRVDDADDLADRARRDHITIDALLAELRAAPQGDLAPLMQHLRSAVAAHVDWEEATVFPALRNAGVDPEVLAGAVATARGAARSGGTDAER